jgi:hypothetical protein
MFYTATTNNSGILNNQISMATCSHEVIEKNHGPLNCFHDEGPIFTGIPSLTGVLWARSWDTNNYFFWGNGDKHIRIATTKGKEIKDFEETENILLESTPGKLILK